MTVLGALARRDAVAGGETRNLTAWGDWTPSQTTWAGENVTASSSLSLLTVYGCVRFICDGISTLPVDVFRRTGDGSPSPVVAPTLIREPSPGLDFTAWATQFLSSLLLAGNFYGLKVYRGTTVDQVVPLDPTKVKPVRDSRQRLTYEVEGKPVSPMDILHVRGIMWPGSDVGLSPVAAARQSIGSGLAAAEFGARFLDQDSTPGGVIEVPGDLTPEQTRGLAAAWAKKHSGKSKRGLPAVLVGGAQWKQTSITQEDSQFLETRQFTAAEIAAQMFLIDPSEIGIGVSGQSLTYSNLEQRNARKVQVTFLPWITRLEHALTALLPRPQYVKLNVNGLLRGDTKTRFEAYGIAIDKKFMVPNEARDLEEWVPLDGGDVVVESAPSEDRAAFLETAARPAPVEVRFDQVRFDSATIEPPVVHVNVEPPAVTVEAPNVTVTPAVTVEAPAVTVANEVHPAGVTVVGSGPKTRRVERDPFGNITKVVEE